MRLLIYNRNVITLINYYSVGRSGWILEADSAPSSARPSNWENPVLRL